MKSSIVTITPAGAKKMLDRCAELIAGGSFAQRNLAETTVELYAREMRAGHWGVTHQGVALAENGAILDGRHRLAAIVKAAVPVRMMMTTGVPLVAMQNGVQVNTIDLVDRGRVRGIGNQLQISHGYANGNRWAALAAAIVDFIFTSSRRLSVTETLNIISVYDREARMIINNGRSDIGRVTPSWAVLTMFAAFNAESANKIADAVLTSAEIKRNSGVQMYALYLSRNTVASAPSRCAFMKYLAAACKAEHEGRTISKVVCSAEAREWLLENNRRQVNRIKQIIGC